MNRSKPGTPPRLTDAEIMGAVNLLKRDESVEFKLSVSDTDRYSTVKALDMDVLEAELRQVVFFDTPDLKLNRAGLVVRARRTRKGGDTVVKLRPIIPDDLPDRLRRSSSFTIEVDMMPGSCVCSGSLKGKTDNAIVKEVLQGKRAIRKLFLPEQRALYKEHAPKGLDLDSLTPFGPINVAKLKFFPGAFDGRFIVAELWFYPDGSRLLELSTKCMRDDAFRAMVETRAFLEKHGVRSNGEQQTKTRKALQYFSHLHDNHRHKRQAA